MNVRKIYQICGTKTKREIGGKAEALKLKKIHFSRPLNLFRGDCGVKVVFPTFLKTLCRIFPIFNFAFVASVSPTNCANLTKIGQPVFEKKVYVKPLNLPYLLEEKQRNLLLASDNAKCHENSYEVNFNS